MVKYVISKNLVLLHKTMRAVTLLAFVVTVYGNNYKYEKMS